METLKFDNTLIEIQNYPICFVNAKLNLFNDFFKGTWKITFEALCGKLKQLPFEQMHLHNSDIKKLSNFLNSEIDALELQGDSEVELQFARDLLKQLPPIQEKDCWFLFQKKVDKSHPPLSCHIDLDPELEKQIDEECKARYEYSDSVC